MRNAAERKLERARRLADLNNDALRLGRMRRLRQRVVGADQILLIGKSLGSFAASAAARANLPAIWITPLWRNHQVVEASSEPPLDDFSLAGQPTKLGPLMPL